MPMLLANFQTAFLLSEFREKCHKYDVMDFFEDIMEIITHNFARFQKSHLDMDNLGRALNTLVIQTSLKKLLSVSWPQNAYNLDKLKEQFHENYAQSNLNENYSASEKRQLFKKVEEQQNSEFLEFLHQYNVFN